MMDIKLKKKFAAALSIISNSFIIILKLTAGIISGSISIISEAIHSLSDCLASILTFFAVSKSSEPADKEHPFGHGKYEDMSGFIEGGLIIFAALFIIYEAMKKLMLGQISEMDTSLGIIVMGIAVITNSLVSAYLFKIAKEGHSISLFADAEHLRTDIYSSLGVLIGLVLIKTTGITILDPIIALIVAMFILNAGLSISKETLNNLLDCALPSEEIQMIEEIIKDFNEKNISGYKDLKSRRTGALKNIEITILCPENMTILECHNLCDEIEEKIEEKLGNTKVTIHAEPEYICSKCSEK